MSYDVQAIREQFPILRQQVHGKPLIYFDNAASSQKPNAVIDCIASYYRNDHSNVHRGVHTLSQRATERFEAARSTARAFLNAQSDKEIIFTKGTTDALNIVISGLSSQLGPDDEVLVSAMEHHSMIVPWQMACERTGATLRVIPVDDDGQIDLDAYAGMLSAHTKAVGVMHVSNAMGTINPIKQLATMAHDVGALFVADGAQATPHLPIDVQELGVDFYCVAGHKMYGPTGIGLLYGRQALLEALPPYQGGGDMIRSVSWEETVYNDLPNKFEAGTPNICGAIALAAAMDFMEGVGRAAIAAHEDALLDYGTPLLEAIDGLRLIGTAANKAGVLSFVVEGAHAHDLGTLLDMSGVAVRVGHHCTQPLMKRMGVSATCRASFGLYNTTGEIDQFVTALQKALRILR